MFPASVWRDLAVRASPFSLICQKVQATVNTYVACHVLIILVQEMRLWTPHISTVFKWHCSIHQGIFRFGNTSCPWQVLIQGFHIELFHQKGWMVSTFDWEPLQMEQAFPACEDSPNKILDFDRGKSIAFIHLDSERRRWLCRLSTSVYSI